MMEDTKLHVWVPLPATMTAVFCRRALATDSLLPVVMPMAKAILSEERRVVGVAGVLFVDARRVVDVRDSEARLGALYAPFVVEEMLAELRRLARRRLAGELAADDDEVLSAALDEVETLLERSRRAEAAGQLE